MAVRAINSKDPVIYHVDNPELIISQYRMHTEANWPDHRMLSFHTIEGAWVNLSSQLIWDITVLPED